MTINKEINKDEVESIEGLSVKYLVCKDLYAGENLIKKNTVLELNPKKSVFTVLHGMYEQQKIQIKSLHRKQYGWKWEKHKLLAWLNLNFSTDLKEIDSLDYMLLGYGEFYLFVKPSKNLFKVGDIFPYCYNWSSIPTRVINIEPIYEPLLVHEIPRKSIYRRMWNYFRSLLLHVSEEVEEIPTGNLLGYRYTIIRHKKDV